MRYGVKTYAQVPNPDGVPESWIAIMTQFQDNDSKTQQELIAGGFTIFTQPQYDVYISEHQAEYDAWARVFYRDALIQEIRDKIDKQTDIFIAEGYIYPPPPYPNGGQFKMDLEHQSTYKGSYDFRAYITFPYTIKGVGQFFWTFNDESEMTQFVLYGFGWMQTVIQTGWTMKTALDSMTYEELQVWKDPRI